MSKTEKEENRLPHKHMKYCKVCIVDSKDKKDSVGLTLYGYGLTPEKCKLILSHLLNGRKSLFNNSTGVEG